MKNSEYEYSFKVKNLIPFINFCEGHGYKKVKSTIQERVIYRNINKTIARVTTDKDDINGKITYSLDFKEDRTSSDLVIERKESLPIYFNDINAVESVLSFLEYKQDNVLKRNRQVYSKDDISFEFDEYLQPEHVLVVAIEGEKEKVDTVYEQVKHLK